MLTKEEYIKKHGVSEKEFLYYCINCLNNKFMRDDDNVNDLKGFLYDLVVDYFELKEKYESLLDKIEELHATIHSLDCELYELNNPKPYKFEELHEDMWVWDDKEQICCQICDILSFNGISVNYHYENVLEFKENRFYPPSKANQGKEQ
ncbi:hypothetical protein [Candidatus Stoquefichus sp. SB1]|uniref:hypothetical protein n=1 Tax=Candidatus Stoquefichus sp. SB1 TaxID=1658109 RepID=UPI00067F684D|nr:hypothetical protein [Candidatus Stoquefichus sp. SB1]